MNRIRAQLINLINKLIHINPHFKQNMKMLKIKKSI